MTRHWAPKHGDIIDFALTEYRLSHLRTPDIITLRCLNKEFKELIESSVHITVFWEDVTRICNVFWDVSYPNVLFSTIVTEDTNGMCKVTIDPQTWIVPDNIDFKLEKDPNSDLLLFTHFEMFSIEWDLRLTGFMNLRDYYLPKSITKIVIGMDRLKGSIAISKMPRGSYV